MPKNLVFISIAGGNRDFLVQSDNADVSHFMPDRNGFSVYSASIPDGKLEKLFQYGLQERF